VATGDSVTATVGMAVAVGKAVAAGPQAVKSRAKNSVAPTKVLDFILTPFKLRGFC
jgi:hypothetical protein